MREFVRAYKSNFYLNRHSGMWLIHILVPFFATVVFLSYFLLVSSYDDKIKLFTFFECVAIVLPLVISLVTAKVVGKDEEAGSFQNMFCILKSKTAVFCGKLCYLLTMGMMSIVLTIFFYGIGYKTMLNGTNFSFTLALQLLLILFLGNVVIYAFHMFLSFRFGKAVSIIFGMIGLIISAISIYGLLGSAWCVISYSWSTYFLKMKEFLFQYENVSILGLLNYIGGIMSLFFVVIIFICSIVAILIWFKHWEGKKSVE